MKLRTEQIVSQYLNDPFAVDLSEWTEIDEAAAEELAKRRAILDLDGLTIISDAALEALMYQEHWLSLNGLTIFSDKTSEILAEFKGEQLEFSGLAILSDNLISALARVENVSFKLNRLRTLSDALHSLAKCKVPIFLDGVADLLSSIQCSSVCCDRGIPRSY